MREFHTQDGTIIHLPEKEQRSHPAVAAEPRCDCEIKLGNDFWFLPMGSCLRPDKTCNRDAG